MVKEYMDPVTHMNNWADRLSQLEQRRTRARLLRKALPYWPVWMFCGLATFAINFNAGVGTLFFGMMTGWQLAKIWTQTQASRIDPKDEEITAAACDEPLS